MNTKTCLSKCTLAVILLCTTFALNAQRQIEWLNRGTFAMRTSASSVLVSWRWLATDPDDVSFNVYRNGVKLTEAPLASATNYADNTIENGTYVVKAVVNNVEQESSENVSVVTTAYFDVPLQIPAGGTTPASEAYTYSANDASVGDVDGDGAYEIILKWDPSNSKDNSQSGYTGNVYIDAYKLDGTLLWRIDLGRNIRAGAHYTQFMVYDLDGDGKAEIACKTAPNTKDGLGNYLSKGPSATDNDASDYRNSSGYILDGPEYLTVFNGLTGAEMATVNYNPPRGTVSSWGDSYGNRVDRFLACVAYLDGERPSLVMCRGYYTRTTLAAWDWRNGNLTQRWFFDSNATGNSGYAGQGNHNLSVVDADGDGKDEIIYGSCAIDDNGTGLYTTGLGHGDALHVTDHAPNRKGLEVFAPHEENGRGISFRDAQTGAIIWQKKALGDIGRGAAADITPDYPGSEFWAAGMGLYNVMGEQISTSTPSINHLIWWDGDLTRELLDGVTISKYNQGTLLTGAGCSSNNSTKSNPCLQVDLWGDWREEVIWRTSDNTKLRIYSTPYASAYRFCTLMHDPVYRLGIAWQNVAYNQPPHVAYYLGNGMEQPSLAPVMQTALKWDGTSGNSWDLASANFKNNQSLPSVFANGQDVLFSLTGNNALPINLTGELQPSSVYVSSPKDYLFGGSGSLVGTMGLTKTLAGKLTLNGTHTYSGLTKVFDGELQLLGGLTSSKVVVLSKGIVSGTGMFGADVEVQGTGTLVVADKNSAGITTINGNLVLGTNAIVEYDLGANTSGDINDKIAVAGNLVVSGTCNLSINKISGQLGPGSYQLATFGGSFMGSLSNIVVDGIVGTSYNLSLSSGALVLTVEPTRDNAMLVWKGGTNNIMDLLGNPNWLNQTVADSFVAGDAALFNDLGNATVVVTGQVPMSGITVNAAKNYTFSGTGTISGTGSFAKENSNTVVMNKYNDYTGATQINGGTLEVTFLNNAGLPSSIGAATASPSNLIVDGGRLRYTGNFTTTNRGMTVGANGAEIETAAGATIVWEGALTGGILTKTGTGTLALEGPSKSNDQLVVKAGTVKLYGDLATPSKGVVFEGGTLNCNDDSGSSNTMSWPITVAEGKSGTINLDSKGYYTGTLTGAGTLNVNIPYVRSDLNGNWSLFAGTLNFASTYSNTGDSPAELRIGSTLGWPNATVNIGSDVSVYHLSSVATKLGALTGTGTLSGSHNWEVGAKSINSTFSGLISAGSLTKVGIGTFTLSQANTYNGYTMVSNGVLTVTNTSGSATGTGVVTVMSGGALSGNGIVGGIVNVESGGVLYGGHTSVGTTLTIQKQVTLKAGSTYRVKVNALFQLADRVTATVGFKAGGTLEVLLSGGVYAKGKAFKVINSPSITGVFDAINPAVPAEGLFWDTSELYSTGVLKVSDVATAVKPVSVLSLVTVYPNPVADRLTVSFPTVIENGTIQIVDLTGKVVSVVDVRSQSMASVNTSLLNGGVYLVRVLLGDETVTRRFVKK